jgi:hypothetical protein
MFGIARVTSIAPPLGFGEQAEVTSPPAQYRVTFEAADLAALATGSSGKRVATADVSGSNVGQLIVLAPALL